MRCDVNISVRPKGRERFGTKVEIKNMNSFSAMQKAIEFEMERQVRAGCEGRGSRSVAEQSPAVALLWRCCGAAVQSLPSSPMLASVCAAHLCTAEPCRRRCRPRPPQVALLREGREGDVVQETRLWDENKNCTYSMRKKEGLADYRYFPEPDLPPLTLTQQYLEEVQVRGGGSY